MESLAQQQKRLIAVVGKGGTGKSALTGLMTRILLGSGKRKILLIDADPTMGLCNLLGVRAGKTIEDVRNEIIRAAGSGKREDKTRMAHTLDYHILEALIEEKGFGLLAMGEPRTSGCFCPANELLKKAIESLSGNFDVLLIDCEAGLEQITRKVIGNIETLMITTDLSMRGAYTAVAIEKAAHKFTRAKQIGLVVNRVGDSEESPQNIARATGIELFGWIPEDSRFSEWDQAGRPIFELPEDSPCVVAVGRIMKRMNLGDSSFLPEASFHRE